MYDKIITTYGRLKEGQLPGAAELEAVEALLAEVLQEIDGLARALAQLIEVFDIDAALSKLDYLGEKQPGMMP